MRELTLDGLLAASDASRTAFWATVLPLLRDALPADLAGLVAVCLDYRLLRVGRRIDAVLVTDRAVLALLVRPGAARFSPQDRRLIEDAALDLADFHAGCAGQIVLPVLVVPNGARPSPVRSLMLPGVGTVVDATRLLLPGLIRRPRPASRGPCGRSARRHGPARPTGRFRASWMPRACCMPATT